MVRGALIVQGSLWLSACAGTWRPGALTMGTQPKKEHVKVWTGRQSHDWHAVRASADSISGVPFFRHPDCDSCRVAVARIDVDSVRVGGEFVDGGTRAFFGVVGFALGSFMIGMMISALSEQGD